MRVFVINKRALPLMPCKPQAARRLLKEKSKGHKTNAIDWPRKKS